MLVTYYNFLNSSDKSAHIIFEFIYFSLVIVKFWFRQTLMLVNRHYIQKPVHTYKNSGHCCILVSEEIA